MSGSYPGGVMKYFNEGGLLNQKNFAAQNLPLHQKPSHLNHQLWT